MNRAKVLPLGMAAAIIIYGIWLIRKPVALTPETAHHQEARLAVYLADNPYVDDPSVLFPLFTGDERSPLRYDQPSEAQQFYLEQRLPEGEQQLPVEKYDAAWAQIKTMPQFSIERGVTLPDEPPQRPGMSDDGRGGGHRMGMGGGAGGYSPARLKTR